MTLQKLVSKFNFEKKFIKDYNAPFFVLGGATKEDLKDYLKMCHDDFNMPYEFMDKILSGNTKIFYHYDDGGDELVYDEYGFLQIDALGRVFVLSRLFDFCIYLHQYKITWFLKKNMEC